MQSLSVAPLGQSREVLISLAARSILPNGSRLPYRSEPVEGEIVVQAPAGLRLFAANGDNARRELPVAYRDGRYHIRLDASVASYWLVLAG